VTVYVFALLCLTAYRATRLLIKDTFPPVLWLRDNLVGGWRPVTEGEQRTISHTVDQADVPFVTTKAGDRMLRWVNRRRWAPDWLAELLSCPWCASAYVSGALVAVTDVVYGVPVPWLVGPAVWAVAALLSSRDWA
jgi:Protein of unknown function (DUF1360)